MGQGKLHPTCHTISLTTTSKIVAFLDMVFGVFGLIWFVLMLARYDIITLDPFENVSTDTHPKPSGVDQLTSLSSQNPQKQVFATNHKVISLTLVAFYTLVNLSVFVLLLVGVHKRSPGICLTWFHIRCAIFVFKVVILLIYILGGRPLYSQIPFIVSMIVHLWGLWVVSCYVDELRSVKFEEQVQEVKAQERVAELHSNDDDEPNGIEAIQRQRMEEILNNHHHQNHSFVIDEKDFEKQPKE